MDLIVAVPLAIVALVAALAAYGAWLIGQDSEAEQQARELSSDSTWLSNGWFALDWLRIGDLPIVSDVEDYLAHLREVAEGVIGDEPAEPDDEQDA